MLSFTHLYILIINICKAYITFSYYIDKIWFLTGDKGFFITSEETKMKMSKSKFNIVYIKYAFFN